MAQRMERQEAAAPAGGWPRAGGREPAEEDEDLYQPPEVRALLGGIRRDATKKVALPQVRWVLATCGARCQRSRGRPRRPQLPRRALAWLWQCPSHSLVSLRWRRRRRRTRMRKMPARCERPVLSVGARALCCCVPCAQLPLRVKLAFALPNLATSAMMLPTAIHINKFYADTLLVNPGTLAIGAPRGLRAR